MQVLELQRLEDSKARRADWKNWGPYVSDRAWGTVREDYSATGEAWEYFPHDHARSRAYRWNEDGIAGFCNRQQNLCLAWAFWNQQDPILKERFFGLTGNQGNHGEDVKELYYYLDSTPTHSYAKMLYKYPQVAYPYAQLVEQNQKRGRQDPEFELLDALGEAFSRGLYFDIVIEYAKADQEDILCQVRAYNRGPEPAPLQVLPHLWFRNTWSWGYDRPKPRLSAEGELPGALAVRAEDVHLGDRWWYVERGTQTPNLLFTENNTNSQRLFSIPASSLFLKDSINDAVVRGREDRVNPDQVGTKVAAQFQELIPAGASAKVRVRFCKQRLQDPFVDFESVMEERADEADQFYRRIQRNDLTPDESRIQRQALAGLMWNKQFYHFSVELWQKGDPTGPKPTEERKMGRNRGWSHLHNLAVLSMPDKWEYPWYAAWDLAFHTVPIALIDPEWAKRQLILILREWYMHPNGQIPAYEWAFGDVNPPLHAWAAWRVYKLSAHLEGKRDTLFLERIFHKLLLNFTWWVNQKDTHGNNIFQGGFLGLDNIGIFDRSKPLPGGGHLEQADGTAWMGMYALNMLAIALELACEKPAYEDVATKFFEHFIYIAHALNAFDGSGLWNEEDGFYYDHLHIPDRTGMPLKIRSFVGLIPIHAVQTIEPAQLEKLPRFRERMRWFTNYRPHLLEGIVFPHQPGQEGRLLLSLVRRSRLERILRRMSDPNQFLSRFGLRSLSKEYKERPYQLELNGNRHTIQYEPAESRTGLFGGNSNWRGPVWFPVNFLMIESLQKHHHYYGEDFKVEHPVGSANWITLDAVARDLSKRLISLFLKDPQGNRPCLGDNSLMQTDPYFKDNLLFHEYFHGDSGVGLGASHQTGWTALVAKLIQQSGGESVS